MRSRTVGNRNVCLVLMTLCMLPSADSAVVCGGQQVRVTDPVTGRVVGCEECKWCSAGYGPSVTCGGSVTVNTGIQCVLCVTRTTYSTGYSPNACDECTKCGPHRAIASNCNATADTQCAAECDKDFYADGWIGICEPCSYCCGDGDDHVIKKCSADGMAANQQCGSERSEYCGRVVAGKSSHTTVIPSPLPTPTHEKGSSEPTGSTAKGDIESQNTTTRATSSEAKNTSYEMHKRVIPVHQKLWFWLAICLPLVAFTVLTVLICWCKYYKQKVQTGPHAQETVVMGGNVGEARSTSVDLPVANTEPHDMSRAPTDLGTSVFENYPTPV